MSAGLIVLKTLASSCSLVMILSSTPSLYDIHKRRDTGDVALFPLIGLWLNCVMVMLYGWASGSYFPLFATYVFGTMVSTAYVAIYFRWTNARVYAWKAIGLALIANLLGSVYVVLGMTGVTGQAIDQVELIAGNMMTVACVLPYVAPFETIKTVFKTRSSASIPFSMCLAGATSNLIWTIEGLFTNDMFILFLSAACSTLGFVQVVLYLIFRPAKKTAMTGSSVSIDKKSVLQVKAPPTKLSNDINAIATVELTISSGSYMPHHGFEFTLIADYQLIFFVSGSPHNCFRSKRHQTMANSDLLLTLRVLTFVTALAVGLSPYPEIRRVHQQQDTDEVSIFPVVTLFGNSYLWMIYSYLIGNFFPLFSVCAFQTASAIVFGVVYWWWCTSCRRFYVLWGVTVVMMVLISIYAAIAMAGVTHQSAHQVEKILGYMCVVMNLCLKVSPLETLKHIIRTKNASSMPVTMSVVAFINGLLWVWTSALEDDMYVLTTNAVGAALGGVQIIVYIIYRPGKIKEAAIEYADSEHSCSNDDQAVMYDLETYSGKVGQTKSTAFVEAKSPL